MLISSSNGIASTIRKHIIAQNALTSGCKAVSIDKSTDLRVVITALEAVEFSLPIGLGIFLVEEKIYLVIAPFEGAGDTFVRNDSGAAGLFFGFGADGVQGGGGIG